MTASTIRRITLAFAVAAAVASLAIRTTAPLAAAGAAPTVTGPIASKPVGDASHDYPFYASVVDLKARKYVEEEYFIEGVANRYNTPQQETGSVIDGGHPYKTRIVVRRPAAPSAFNGTVILEWNNVTAGHDLDIDWFQSHDYFIANGYVWIGVTPQRIGVEALKVWNAARYGSLDVTHGGAVEGDALSYDIFTAAAQAVRTPGAVNVLPGFKVERIFATGHSQSAGRLGTYVNSVHPLTPVFDAVVLHGGGARVRTDVKIKVWKLLAETDVLGGQAANRQPDSDTFRSWETAGASHVDIQFASYSRQLSARDGSPVAPGFAPGGGARVPAAASAASSQAAPTAAPAAPRPAATSGATGGGQSPCDRPPYSRIPFHFVMNAAFDHLVRWVKDGTPPPSAPPIETSSVGPPAVATRDAAGNALGGLRLSQHAVPTATNTGQNSGAGFCRLYGSFEAFDAPTLVALYPTHAAYVAAVREQTAKNLKAGFILKADADATITEAERATVGKKASN